MLWNIRVSQPMGQVELAERSGVSQAVISGIERGRVTPSAEQKTALATALRVPPALLDHRPVPPRVLAPLQRSLPAHARNRLNASLALGDFHVGRILGAGTFELPRVERQADPRQVAGLVRLAWRIGDGPIPDMVELLEERGVVCLMRDTQAIRRGVIGSWPRDHRPLVFLGARATRRARRWSLAVELGFAMMHSDERTAEAFAAELLMPHQDVDWQSRGLLGVEHRGPLSLLRVAELETEWGVPAEVLVKYARRIGAINATRHRELISAVHFIGTDTPDARGEQPQTLARAVGALVAEGRSRDQVARDALLDPATFRADYLAGSSS